jgi:hypothetical protein
MAAIKMKDLIHLTNEEIKQVYKIYNIECIEKAPALIKEYVLKGKNWHDITSRLNRVFHILNIIVVDRFITDKL